VIRPIREEAEFVYGRCLEGRADILQPRSQCDEGRNFGLKSGVPNTNSEGEMGGEWGGSIPSSSDSAVV